MPNGPDHPTQDYMPRPWIDVWNPGSFDRELHAFLDQHAELIAAFLSESRRLFVEREAQTVRGMPKLNPHGPAWCAMRDAVTTLMADRVIRTWHFTRITDREIAAIARDGLQPMTIDLIERRLDALVQDGVIDSAGAAMLFAASPYHRQHDGNREGRIWLTAQPIPIDDDAVIDLLGKWGGESISFTHRSGAVSDRLAAIGKPAIIEVALPLRITTRVGEAAGCVIDSYSAMLGFDDIWPSAADIVAVEDVRPEWIRAIHREGEPAFWRMGRGYPESFTAP